MNNLRAEIWAVHVGAELGIDANHVEDVVRDALKAAARGGSVTESESTPNP